MIDGIIQKLFGYSSDLLAFGCKKKSVLDFRKDRSSNQSIFVRKNGQLCKFGHCHSKVRCIVREMLEDSTEFCLE